MIAARATSIALLFSVAACQPMGGAPSQSVRAAATTTVPQCTLTVVNGYPTSYVCNALAQAVQETLSCELEELDALGKLHGIKPGMPAGQITWWCQTEMASQIVLDCAASATNPCAQMHVYPGIAVYNIPTAIQQAMAQNIVPPVDLAPDGLPCPNAAGGDLGGVADMDGLDGPYVNWVMSRDNLANQNLWTDGDFTNIMQRIPFYQGACTRPATHTLFLAQRQLHANQSGKPSSGCPTLHTPFALLNGVPDLPTLNNLATDVGCPTMPSMTAAVEAERQACLAIIADEERITRDGAMGLFPGAFTFAQLRRQYAAFSANGLQCNAQFGLVDRNPTACNAACTPTTACGVNGCVAACGSCAASNLECDPNGQCVAVCAPRCNGKQCGPDGCGGVCGQCTSGSSCDIAGHCEPLPQSTQVSFARDIIPVLDAKCSGCHSNGQLDFDFTPAAAYQSCMSKSKSCPGRAFVIPGDAEHSYLIDKMIPVLGLCAGSSMRYDTTNAEMQALVSWINQGALNN